MATEPKSRRQQIMDVMTRYASIVEDGLQERWGKFEVQIYDAEMYEVIGGLLARQATLTIHLARTPQNWTGHIAPLILRSMTDAHITLAWILKDPISRAKKYIMYGLGQEKLFIEHLKQNKKDASGLDENTKKHIEIREEWLNSQRRDFMTEVNIGSWSGMNARDMAEEADCKGLYNYAYLPFSGVVHNMWQHVAVYNLEPCHNPIHKYHRVPSIRVAPLDIDYVYRSAKYVSRSFKIYDSKFKITCSTPLPVEWFLEEMESVGKFIKPARENKTKKVAMRSVFKKNKVSS